MAAENIVGDLLERFLKLIPYSVAEPPVREEGYARTCSLSFRGWGWDDGGLQLSPAEPFTLSASETPYLPPAGGGLGHRQHRRQGYCCYSFYLASRGPCILLKNSS